MSYQHMDHADWMEKHIRALKKNKVRFVKDSPENLNDFQKKVCDIVGMVGGGIYNAPIGDKIDWTYGGTGVSFIWKREMATWDFNQLTMLVFLCHEARIRCHIEAKAPNVMRMTFWQRKHEGGMAIRHPNLDEAVKWFKEEYLPKDHRILYQQPVQDAAK